ncbi:MAG: dTDP-glucose 4,6-dehydratase [Candidatus Gracilibacteria bacterium]|nr:dTDP-glucose 4,6-dehydratase [Candidatus Gracilibacteria bacterium]
MKQKIIITGGAGFIGSNFLNKYVLLHPEIDFINIDALTYAGKLENISSEVSSSSNYAFEKVDIRDIESLKKVYKKYSPTDIIHFAAESHVDNSIKNPIIFTQTNVLGTQNLLDCHREFGLNRFHHISTDEVYGDLPNGGFFTENTPINPSSPYSASKAGSDLVVKAYGRTFGVDYVITRCSNNYGPNQDNEKLIPHFIELLQNNKPVTVYGDGSNIRDWLYVEDHCDAIWEVFTCAENKSIYNIGGNNEYTNLEITKLILHEMGKGEEFISFVEDRKGHDVRYAIDATKLKTELAWEPKVRFEVGIVKTIKYYLSKNLGNE